MKLLLVTRGFPPRGRWGSEGYSHDLAEGLARRGHCVDVFFANEDGPPALSSRRTPGGARVFELGIPLRRGKPFRDSYFDPRQDEAFGRLLATEGPYRRVHFTALGGGVSIGQIRAARPRVAEIVVTLTEFLPFCHRGNFLYADLEHCTRGPEPELCSRCVMQPAPFQADASRQRLRAGAARLLSFLGRHSPLPSPGLFAERRARMTEALALVDVFVAPSAGLAARYVELGLPPDKLVHLPYALDPERYASFEHRPSAGALRLTYMGQIAPHKGVLVLVEALERLPAGTRGKLRLTIRGAATKTTFGGYEAMLRRRIGVLPIEMPGPFPPERVADVLAETDCVVVPSLWLENMPLVLMHARSCGIPVVASRVGGIEGFVREGETGLLVDPGDAAAWAETLARLVEEGDLWGRLASGTRAAEPWIGFDAHLDQVLGLSSGAGRRGEKVAESS